MKLTEEQITSFCEQLEGTCNNPNRILAKVLDVDDEEIGDWTEELDLETLNEIDNRIFLCEGCGWWYDMEGWNAIDTPNGSGWYCLECAKESGWDEETEEWKNDK